MNKQDLEQTVQNLKKISAAYHLRMTKLLGIKPVKKQSTKSAQTVYAQPLTETEKAQQSLLQIKTKYYGEKTSPEDVRRLNALEVKEKQAQFQAQVNKMQFQVIQLEKETKSSIARAERHERVLYGTGDTPGLFKVIEMIIETKRKESAGTKTHANFQL
jgi:hypothetical protein